MKKMLVLLMVTVVMGLTGCNDAPEELLSIDTSRIMTDNEGNMIILEDLDSGKVTKINRNDLNSFVIDK